jgi:hypothetical protein
MNGHRDEKDGRSSGRQSWRYLSASRASQVMNDDGTRTKIQNPTCPVRGKSYNVPMAINALCKNYNAGNKTMYIPRQNALANIVIKHIHPLSFLGL